MSINEFTVGRSSGATDTVFEPEDGPAILLRSYTEGKWAAAFDAAGIKYDFELEYYKKPPCGTPFEYLPDLYLPNENIFIEVKPEVDWRKIYDPKRKRSYTEPFCLWQQQNETELEAMRERLAKPKVQGEFDLDDITAGPTKSKPFTDVWVVGGQNIQSSKVATYSIFPEGGPDCESCNNLAVIRQMVFHVQELGICPECGRLSFFWPGRTEETINAEKLTTLSCYHCGWEHSYENPKGVFHSVFAGWSAALSLVGNQKARLFEAFEVPGSNKTKYSYEADGKTKYIDAKPDRYTARRG